MLSTQYLVEAGRTSPDTRLMAISTKPKISRPRRGLISAHTSGSTLHAFASFLVFDLPASSVAIVEYLSLWMRASLQKLYAKCLANRLGEKPGKYGYATTVLARALGLVRRCPAARRTSRG